MEIDLTWSVAGILSASAILSPIFTALINNKHQRKMKKIDFEHERYKETIGYRRSLIEAYMRNFEKYTQNAGPQQNDAYAASYGALLLFAPEDIQSKMIEVNEYVVKNEFSNARQCFNALVPALSALSQGSSSLNK